MIKPIVKKVTVYHTQVMARLEKGRKRILFKQGGYLRTTMQRSMRYSDKPSQPGKPPHAHKKTKRGPLLRKLIKFAVAAEAGSVVCGPIITGGPSFKPVPQVLDQGGVPQRRQLKQTTFHIGQIGPIRYLGNHRFYRTRLTTQAQADRASRLAQEENAVRERSLNKRIAPRPFTAPVFTDGGENFEKLIEKENY